jgi:hypothetical protein
VILQASRGPREVVFLKLVKSMSQEILSPPYPSNLTTARRLYDLLGDVRDWVLTYRDDLNVKAGRDVILLPREPASCELYVGLSVVTHASHVICLRKLREHWDSNLRDHEDAWDCAASVRARIGLVQAAAMLLADAFISDEARELRREQAAKNCDHPLHGFMNFLNTALTGEFGIMEQNHGEDQQEADDFGQYS